VFENPYFTVFQLAKNCALNVLIDMSKPFSLQSFEMSSQICFVFTVTLDFLFFVS